MCIRDRKYRGGVDWTMPPDWRKRMWRITHAYSEYDTDNIVAPIWATDEQKERMREANQRYKMRLEAFREGHGSEPEFDHTSTGDWYDASGNERKDERRMVTPEEGWE